MAVKFFITHSGRDVDFARRLADDLRTRGLDGFLDVYSIKGGENIVRRINEGLKECDVYIPILSHAAFESPWCQEEIDTAIMLRNDRRQRGRPKIIPVIIDDCLDMLPPILKKDLYIDFRGDYTKSLHQLLDAALAGGETKPTSVDVDWQVVLKYLLNSRLVSGILLTILISVLIMSFLYPNEPIAQAVRSLISVIGAPITICAGIIVTLVMFAIFIMGTINMAKRIVDQNSDLFKQVVVE